MRKGGIHIIDTNGELTLEIIRNVFDLHKSIDSIAKKYIDNYNKFSILFSNHSSKASSETIKADAYHYAELEIDSVRIMHQANSCWSIFDREEKNLLKRAEHVSKKLLLYGKYPGLRIFTVETSDDFFVAQGYIDGQVFFSFQAGNLLNRIGFFPSSIQREYLNSRHFEKTNPLFMKDFFQIDHQDFLKRIEIITDPEQLAALFEEMLSMQLFFNYSY